MFPLIPFLCAGGVVGGVLGYAWYERLSAQEQERANRLAAEYATKLFCTSLENLTHAQRDTVHGLVEQHFKS